MNQRARFEDLATTFHTMATRDVKTPADAAAIVCNVSQSRGTRAAASFLLHVADPNTHPLDVRAMRADLDVDQQAAIDAWLRDPWYMV